MKRLRWKLILIIAVAALSAWGIWPIQRKIRLGLDLKGGMHLVLQVHMDDALRAQRDHDLNGIRAWLQDKGWLAWFRFDTPAVDRIEIRAGQPPDPQSFQRAFSELGDFIQRNYTAYHVEVRSDAITLQMRPELIADVKRRTSEQAVLTIRRRVDEYGLAEVVVAPQGATGERILVQLPGVEDPSQVKALIRETSFLEFRLVLDFATTQDELTQRYQGRLPEGTEILPGWIERDDGGGRPADTGFYLVRKEAVITGQDLEYAYRCRDQVGLPAVCFRLSRRGGERFYAFTGQHIGDPLGIVLDRRVITAPRIQAQIRDEGQITGRFTPQEAERLAIQLRSGALPAAMTILEERQIGPALGRDSIRKGAMSSLIGAAVVMLFMLFYYRGAGVNANLALVLNVLIILACLAYFKATLTLPGIAGIALTIGMAVDANVLIFERIKEELRAGKTVRTAIDLGFHRAWSAIFDSNMTTILSALALYIWGTGPVQGFAITLTIGLLANLFTAVFVSRTIFDLVLGERPVERLSI
jgi:preprotein translocase subunit SecD